MQLGIWQVFWLERTRSNRRVLIDSPYTWELDRLLMEALRGSEVVSPLQVKNQSSHTAVPSEQRRQ